MKDQLWTTNQAAHALNITPATLRGLARRGEVPHLRVGNRLRFSPGIIDHLTDAATHIPGPAADQVLIPGRRARNY